MKSKIVFFVSAFFVFLFFSFETVRACSCAARETCQYFSDAKVVFVGRVLDSTEKTAAVKRRGQQIGSNEWGETEYSEKRQISRLRVEESFIGTGGRTELSVETEISSSCGLTLQKDVSYIIYAGINEAENTLTTHFCSGTKPVSAAREDLIYLRANKNNRSVVSGRVGFGKFRELNPARLLEYGVTTVSLENEEKQQQANIEQNGLYNFLNVSPGKYKIKVVLPDFLTAIDDYNPGIAEELGIGDQSEIEVSEHGCLKKDFLLEENGRIGGRITGADGKPVEDITVYLVPVSKTGRKIKQEDACYDNGLCLDTDKNGNYFFKGLKAGRYLIGVRLGDYIGNDSTDAAYIKTYFPGVAAEKNAVPVNIKFGALTDKVDFKLTGKYREGEIKGRVFYKDNRPAANVRVRYVARTPDLKENGITFIKTDENGRFSIAAYENHAYLIGALADENNESLEAVAVVVNVLPKKEIKEIKLVLDQNGNGNCKKCGGYMEFPTKILHNK